MSDYNGRIGEAIQTLQLASEMSQKYYHKPLLLTYSGGKDSDVMLHLALESGIPFEIMNSHTTVDAPETVYHIRKVFEKLSRGGIKTEIRKPKKTMWELIATRTMPPTRLVRYCCQELKESSTPNRMVATGVRKTESQQRRSRNAFELRATQREKRLHKTLDDMREAFKDALQAQNDLGQTDNETNAYDCIFIERAKQGKDTVCNPIINFTDNDIWKYIKDNNIEVCELYHKGYTRVGCIGCPMGGRKHQLKEFSEYPTYERAYKRAFQKMIESSKTPPRNGWETGEDVFKWWVQDPNIKGQISFEEYAEREHIQTVNF